VDLYLWVCSSCYLKMTDVFSDLSQLKNVLGQTSMPTQVASNHFPCASKAQDLSKLYSWRLLTTPSIFAYVYHAWKLVDEVSIKILISRPVCHLLLEYFCGFKGIPFALLSWKVPFPETSQCRFCQLWSIIMACISDLIILFRPAGI